MAVKLFVGNYKGGVGKTTSSFYLANEISGLTEKKVLLIDLDPQCSLSEACVRSYNDGMTLYDLDDMETFNYVLDMMGRCNQLGLLPPFDFGKIIKPCKSILGQVDFCPVSLYYKTVPASTARDADMRREEDLDAEIGLDGLTDQMQKDPDKTILYLPQIVRMIEKEYDYEYIFFDCPPSNNILTRSVFLLSDYYLIPYIGDYVSSEGVDHYISTISRIYRTYCIKHPDAYLYRLFFGERPELLGLFECMRSGNSNSRAIFREDYPRFHTVIKSLVAVADSLGMGRTSYNDGGYAQLATEILEELNKRRFGGTEPELLPAP